MLFKPSSMGQGSEAVLGAGDNLKVRRVNAELDVAQVVNVHPFSWPVASVKIDACAMRTERPIAGEGHAVSATLDCSCPEPARAEIGPIIRDWPILVNVCPESSDPTTGLPKRVAVVHPLAIVETAHASRYVRQIAAGDATGATLAVDGFVRDMPTVPQSRVMGATEALGKMRPSAAWMSTKGRSPSVVGVYSRWHRRFLSVSVRTEGLTSRPPFAASILPEVA